MYMYIYIYIYSSVPEPDVGLMFHLNFCTYVMYDLALFSHKGTDCSDILMNNT